MASKVLMAMKALLVFAVLSAVNACSKDNPCLYYGTCVSSNGTSFCKCQPGYTGAFCETKLRGLVVCGTYTKRIATSKNTSLVLGTPLVLATCAERTKCFSVRYTGNPAGAQESDTVEVLERRCINASYCSQGCTHVRKAVKGTNITSCASSCCNGDFCNAMELLVNRTLVVNPCESIPCLNHGKCKYTNRNYTCVCQDNYTGRSCEKYIPHPSSACQSSPCGINTTCIEDHGKFSCVNSVAERKTGLKYDALTYIVGAPMAVIIALIICIVFLLHHLRKKNRLLPTEDTENKDDKAHVSGITSQTTSEISMATMIQDPANNSQPDDPPYFDLKPTHDKNTAYQSLDVYANENIHKIGTDASLQGSIPHGEYMDLKPRQDVHYEKLTPKETTPQQSYEHMA